MLKVASLFRLSGLLSAILMEILQWHANVNELAEGPAADGGRGGEKPACLVPAYLCFPRAYFLVKMEHM